MPTKVHNFGAGPAKLPEEVYEIIRNELTNFEGTQISLLETSHRSQTYMKLNTEVQNVVRRLLNVPDNYKVLFLAAGGTGQFAAIPLNLISRTGTADYIVTGDWSAKAAKEAKKYGKVNLVLPPRDSYTEIPDQSLWKLDPNASYVYICTNETIHGVEFDFVPDTKGVPLVADMSSNIMSKKIDVSKYGMIYAGAQKNIGTSGVALVIIREDLLGLALPICPSVLDWAANAKADSILNTPIKNNSDLMLNYGMIYAGAQKNIGTSGVALVIIREDLLGLALPICPSVLDWAANAKADSILNTPPMFAIYVMGRVLQWVEANGGVEGMAVNAAKKASLVYGIIEQSNGFYYAPVAKDARSKMNVPFRIGNPGNDALEKEFLKGAEALGLIQLKGHRSVGGIRASIYNAVTVEEVEILAKYMNEFQKKHSK